MSSIKITKSIYEAESQSNEPQVADVAYVGTGDHTLMMSIRFQDKGEVRRSEDNGRTWSMVESWDCGGPIDDVRQFCRDVPHCWSDPKSDKVVRIWHENENRTNIVPWHPQNIGYLTRKMFYQVSSDQGQTWSDARQLIAQGCDENKWAPGIVFGRNSTVISTKPYLQDDNGRFMLPYNGLILFGDTIHNPDIPAELASPDGTHQFLSGYFFGTWQDDGDVMWQMGEGVTLPQEYSCDGADEPSGDFLPNGDLFVVYRARTFPNTGQKLPGMHYYAISHDQGKSWDPPQPLVFDDGSYAMAPACLPNVFRSSKNGRVYVITNFTEHIPENCDPRNELYIVEIDPETCRIIRNSMTAIERAEPEEGVWPPPRFSNFTWYEDRQTGDLVFFMTHGTDKGLTNEGCPAHAYRYVIQLPST